MSVMPPNPYHQLGQFSFGTDWSNFQNAYASTTFSNYDFTRSPNTSGSGGSDESMNQSNRVDPKRSPKYLEKRAKNNEAAKKSRKVRKEREIGYQKENEELKKQLETFQEQNRVMSEKLQELTKLSQETLDENDAVKRENAELKKRLEALQPHPFRDISNIPRYETLN